MSGCIVVSDKGRLSLFVTLRLLRTFDSKYVTQLKPDSTRQDVGKANNTALFSVLRGMQGRRGAFDSVFISKCFIQAVKFRGPTQSY